eukprot:13702735-Alexandrium_andersonii.AAC.1
MSASLVGSEMCIRDRGVTETEPTRTEYLSLATGRPSRQAWLEPRDGAHACLLYTSDAADDM